MHFSLAFSPTSSSETSEFLFWTTLNGQAPEPKQPKTGPGVTTGFEILILLKNWHCANAQIRARISCVHTCTLLQSRSNTKKLKKKPPGSETNKPLFLTNLFIYACDQVIPHDFTRHFSSCSLFPNKSQKKSAKPNTGSFRYFLKTIWAMKLKVKAKSTAIHVFTGLCRGFQSNESYDKCTATLDTIL